MLIMQRKSTGHSRTVHGRDSVRAPFLEDRRVYPENMVRAYIRNQEDEDERYDQMKLEMG